MEEKAKGHSNAQILWSVRLKVQPKDLNTCGAKMQGHTHELPKLSVQNYTRNLFRLPNRQETEELTVKLVFLKPNQVIFRFLIELLCRKRWTFCTAF